MRSPDSIPWPRRPIQVLPPAVAERIAAGEVIERPASVVKELVENALDAGATEITVSLEDGGKALIEVLDNGHGLDPASLWLATQRHATSKLGSLDDLDRIRTLGFRGEALPSVAAVSELKILSRTPETETAYELELGFDAVFGKDRADPPSAVTFGHFLGAEHGTRIQARGLFSQIPARLKFLKSQGAEVAQVREWLERLALAFPEVGFRLESDKRVIIAFAPADPVTRVRAVLADSEDYPIITETATLNVGGELRARIHWVQGLSLPTSRRVVQVVNRRAIRDRMLQQALLSGFRQALLPGQFPAIALYLEIDPAQIDVNVHPTKAEVRFLDSRRVFKAVDTAVTQALARAGAPAYIPAMSARAPEPGPVSRWNPPRREYDSAPAGWTFRGPPVLPASDESTDSEMPTASLQGESLGNPLVDARYVGVLFNTYIAHEQGDELVLVDQHAADERIRFERLRRRFAAERDGQRAELSTQELLLPEAVSVEPEQGPRLRDRLEWLTRAGFGAELFGESTVLFRAVPAEWGAAQLRQRLRGLVERLLDLDAPAGAGLGLDESVFEKLASEACHSSVRAGDRLEDLEARTLVGRLFDCAHPWNCPHGRPTVVRIPRGKLEEWFQRRV